MLNKEIAKELMKKEGEVRGIVFITDREFVIKEKGQFGLKKLQEELEKLGYPIYYKEIRSMDFYPIGLRVISLLGIKTFLEFSDEKIQEMGVAAPKLSFLIRIFSKYFLSIKIMAKRGPIIWRKHYTKGDLKVSDLNEEKRYIILQLSNLDLHPIFCKYLLGYFSTIGRLVVKNPVKVTEKECVFLGGNLHKFILEW